MKIDAYAHILTPRYRDRVIELLEADGDARSIAFLHMLGKDPSLFDLSERERIMDDIGPDYRQVLTIALTSTEYRDPVTNLELARLANAELGELAAARPDRFRGWVAQAALLDIDRGLAELERAFLDGALGAQVNTHSAGLPLDDESFAPFFEFMARAGRPIWVHPNRPITQSEFPEHEPRSRFTLYSKTGWPTDTTNAMLRLTYSGVFERWPGLRVLAHHGGGTMPMIAGRLVEPPLEVAGTEPLPTLRRLYADTAVFGNPIAIRAAIEFFGADKVVFGTDFGFTSTFARRTVDSVESAVPDPQLRDQIYHRNFERMIAG